MNFPSFKPARQRRIRRCRPRLPPEVTSDRQVTSAPAQRLTLGVSAPPGQPPGWRRFLTEYCRLGSHCTV